MLAAVRSIGEAVTCVVSGDAAIIVGWSWATLDPNQLTAEVRCSRFRRPSTARVRAMKQMDLAGLRDIAGPAQHIVYREP